MQRTRFTMRGMMLFVAAAAILAASAIQSWRRTKDEAARFRYLKEAEWHRHTISNALEPQIRLHQTELNTIRSMKSQVPIESYRQGIDRHEKEIRSLEAKVAHHEEMAQKYKRASENPRAPVPPDPPEPK